MGYAVTAADASVRVTKEVAGAASKPRVYRFTCKRCGARCEPDRNIGCSHQAERISSRHHVGNGIIR